MVKKKTVDWKKKFEQSEKECKKESEHYTNKIKTLEKQLQEEKKGCIIEIEAQTFRIKDIKEARYKVKQLIDSGIWFLNLQREK